MTVPNKGHGRLRGIKASRKRKTGYIRFTRIEESWSPQFPKITFHSTIFKVLLLIGIAIPVSLIPAYGYYANIYLPSLPNPNRDPFTTLWNGQIPSTFTSGKGSTTITFFQNLAGSTAGVSFVNITIGDFIGAKVNTIVLSNWTGWCSISDDAGNTWHILNPTTGTDIVAYSIVTIPFTNDRVLFHPCGVGSATGASMVQIYHTPGIVGNTVFATTDTLSITTTTANSVVWESYQGVHVASFTSSQTLRGTVDGGVGNCESVDGDKTFVFTGTQSLSGSSSGGCSVTPVHAAVELKLGTPISQPCEQVGYHCFDSFITTGDIRLNSTSAGNAVAITTSQIDLSTGVNKSIAFGELHSLGSLVQAKEVAWFLTLNGTITNSTSYNPLDDKSVALEAVEIWNSTTSVNYYLYVQRTTGTSPRAGALTDNAYPLGKCPQSSTIFLCAFSTKGSNANAMSLALNFTGNSNGSGGNGESYFCIDPGAGSTTCQLGGVNNVQVNLANTNFVVNFTQPWINIQQKYYLGFWSLSPALAPSPVVITSSNTESTFSPVVSLYTPNGSGKTQGQDFWGLIGSTLGGAWNAVAGALGPVVSPILGLGNSILSVVISALIQWLTLMINGAVTTVKFGLTVLQSVLNAFGTFAGWGPIGDQFFSFMSGVITYFTTGLGDALGWLSRLILRSIDLIKTANFWVTFYLNGLLNFMADALNLISEVVTFATKITTFIGSSYAFLIILFFLWYTADMGLAGAHAWFETMKWLAFISFDFLERMINFGISSITWLFGRIPTLDGTTLPELPTIAIGGGPIWPSTDMTALREGNFFAYFAQMIGVAFLIFFETSGLPGSIGSNVTGTAAGNMAPFVTIFLILISVTSLLFVLNIPAKMARQAFGLDDLKPTSLSKFSTGPISTGGVSGHFVRRHVDRKAKIVINRGLGVGGLRPHLRRPKPDLLQVQAKA